MRCGVGAGEAGGTAPSLSVIADYYPPAQRPLAIGLFTLNGPFGVFVGATFGAWAAANIGWRNAFIVIGMVGILIAPILIWLVREPARGQMDAHKPADEALPFSQSLAMRSEEHTSELQSLMRISYAVFCLKQKKKPT